MKVRVTFRNEHDNLVSMFNRPFDTVDEAKREIETDADFFLYAHRNTDKAKSLKVRQSKRWIDTDNTDYFRAIGRDGEACYWQYFVEK